MKALGLAVALLLPAAAFAQEPVCTHVESVPGFEGFARPAAGPLVIGKATAVTLSPDRPPLVAKPASRPFRPGSYRGGAIDLQITQAGRYRIALSQKAWLAVLKAAGEVASVAHEHGPACSGIAKIVSFDLAPGRYAVVLSEATIPQATVMVVPN